MIIGKPREELTYSSVVEKVGEYAIYRFYLGRDFKIGEAFNSPFRKDKHPSFLIGNRGNFLHHTDLGNSNFKGNCIHFVMQLFGDSYHEALMRVDVDFGLGISGGEVKDFDSVIATYDVPDVTKVKETRISVRVKAFTKEDLKYWSEYYQSEEDLKREKVYSVREIRLNTIKLPIERNELVFGYLYTTKWKIYRPHSVDKKNKWLSNINGKELEGLKDIPKGTKNIIITKSKKDKMVLSKVFPYVVHVQSENLGGFTEENVAYLQENFKNVYINFDNDVPGKENSLICTHKFGFKHINVPDEYLKEGIKDFADMAKIKGLYAVKQYFKQKQII